MTTGPPTQNAGAATPASDCEAKRTKVASIIPRRRRCSNCRGLFKPRAAAYSLCAECYRYRRYFEATCHFLELGR
jgi:protein-arginine kinase activator protein McsA